MTLPPYQTIPNQTKRKEVGECRKRYEEVGGKRKYEEVVEEGRVKKLKVNKGSLQKK